MIVSIYRFKKNPDEDIDFIDRVIHHNDQEGLQTELTRVYNSFPDYLYTTLLEQYAV